MGVFVKPYTIVTITLLIQLAFILGIVYIADAFFGTYPKREWITFFGVMFSAAVGFWFMNKMMEE